MIKKVKILLVVIFSVTVFGVPSFAHALSIAVHVPEKYTDVKAGERFYFEVEIKYPENPKRKDLRFVYEIREGDKIIAQAKFLKAIETQASFMDFIIIPETAKKGLHIINVKIQDYESFSEEVSTSFFVKSKWDTIQLYFFVLLGIVLFMGILILDILLVLNRKKKNKWLFFKK